MPGAREQTKLVLWFLRMNGITHLYWEEVGGGSGPMLLYSTGVWVIQKERKFSGPMRTSSMGCL